MRQNPERLAWIILLASFATCVLLVISLPLTLRWWLDTAYVGLEVTSSVQQGTLQVACGTDTMPIAITEQRDNVCPGVERLALLSQSADQGLLTVRTAGADRQPVAVIQVGNNTQAQILQARAPRFSFSSRPNLLIIRLESGRLRVSAVDRALVQVQTNEALVQIEQGSFLIQADPGATRVEAYEDQVLVAWTSRGEGISLKRLESIVLPPPDGLLRASAPAQDLLGWGDLSALEPDWEVYSKDIEFEGESRGEVVLGADEGVSTVGFTRLGRGHAETGIVRSLDRDVRDLEFLQLRLVLRVLEQDVPVCGTRGTECPVMVKLEYEDSEDDLRSWVQGFYAVLDSNRLNPPYCTICSPRADHLRVEPGEWYVYDSPNLLPLLNQAGPPAARILSLSLYASGHAYRSELSRIELLVR
ncbi:MAG: hypothetical protein JW850_01710 [Thermoflexales bacterium]|nr:hypothetical protein [Thermoflexales bacterium]